MDDTLLKSRQYYADLVARETDKAARVARYPEDAHKEGAIWKDIMARLDLATAPPGTRVLDVGCGCGTFTDNMVALARERSLVLHLLDFPEVIDVLRTQHPPSRLGDNISLIPAMFPSDVPPGYLAQARFDRILMYSVIQYSGEPLRLIRAAAGLLAPHGLLFVGDVPNVSRKGRFLSSATGRAFHAAYKKIPIESVPAYTSHQDYSSRTVEGNPLVNDQMVATAFTELREAGLDVFVVAQPPDLPFCLTREDILVRRYD